MDLTNIVTGVFSGLAGSAVVVYCAKSLFDGLLKQDLEKFKITLKAEYDIKHEKFVRLHSDQVELSKKLYSLTLRAIEEHKWSYNYVDPEATSAARKTARELSLFLAENRPFLPPKIINLVSVAVHIFEFMHLDLNPDSADSEDEYVKQLKENDNNLHKLAPKLRKDLEAAIRELVANDA